MSDDGLATIPADQPDVIALPDEIRAQLAKDREVLRGQIGTVKLSTSQQAALLARATIAQVEVKPTGEIYMPGIFYRNVLHAVFGPDIQITRRAFRDLSENRSGGITPVVSLLRFVHGH